MLKKITSAVTISALAALSLVSIASASLGDSFDITGTDHANKVAQAEYANFTIANGDPNEEGGYEVTTTPMAAGAAGAAEETITACSDAVRALWR